MKILFHTYNTCFQNEAGGMQTRVKDIKKRIEKRGIIVDYFSPASTKLEEYDALHLFKLEPENYALVKCAKDKGLKIIISSVIPLMNEKKLLFMRMLSKLPILTTYKMIKYQMDAADTIISETAREKKFIVDYYKVNNKKIKVIPNGIDIEKKYNGKEIFDFLGKKIEYVLCVGRIDENKNQLNLIKAMKKTDIELLLIGGPAKGNEQYYKKCVQEIEDADNIHLLGWLEKDSLILKSAYANCKLLVVPSYRETFGLVILEGIAAGANVAISETLPILDYSFLDSSHTFNPNNIDDIRNTVLSAYDNTKKCNLYEQAQSIFSWDSVISQYLICYRCEERENDKRFI